MIDLPSGHPEEPELKSAKEMAEACGVPEMEERFQLWIDAHKDPCDGPCRYEKIVFPDGSRSHRSCPLWFT